jgi:hypothetical protein
VSRAWHLVTANCPVDYLEQLLASRVTGRLVRADGCRDRPVASCGAPAMIGDVVRLYPQGRLGEIGGLGAASIRGIRLARCRLAWWPPRSTTRIAAGCPVSCLRSVISALVLNRLARADGRGIPVAPGRPPVTVGDVLRPHHKACSARSRA